MPVVWHWRVEGEVQGVGFRWFVSRAAGALEISGWVRNTPDGAVEVAARGSEADLLSLEKALSAGPSQARVRRVVRSAAGGGDEPEASGFRIRT